MTLIKCPGCGHTVSSVASKCPQCGTQLSQFRFVQGEGGALTECRRCSKKVLSGATACPYCGVSHPGRRSPYAVIALLAVLTVPALVLGTLRDRSPDAAQEALPASTLPPQPRTVTSAASPPAEEVTAPASAAEAVPETPPPAREMAPTETKWTQDWANVREGRALGTAVVRVLRPGSSIQVTDRQAGWWALYLDGRVVGYVAGSVLGDQPPEGRPETERSP